jgi:hypothetical protein
MTRLVLTSLALAISILPLYAQSISLHTDRSGYTTGTTVAMDYDRLAKLAEEQIADKERGTIDANTGRPAPDAIDLSRFSVLAGR